MKTMVVANLLVLLLLYLKEASGACASPFTEKTDYQGTYCIKCDTTCDSCFEDTPASCVACPADFTFNPNTSYCIPPATSLISTRESSYKWPNFAAKSSWSGYSGTSNCGYSTLIMGTGSNVIWQSDLSGNFEMRVLVSLWQVDGVSSSAKITITAVAPDNS